MKESEMADNYDNVCAICGQEVHADTLYYCCPECHRTHRDKRCGKEEDRTTDMTEKVVLNQILESEPK